MSLDLFHIKNKLIHIFNKGKIIAYTGKSKKLFVLAGEMNDLFNA